MAGSARKGGKLKVTLEQRRVLLQRLRREVEEVVEDLNGTAETMRVISISEHRSRTEQATARLIEDEQARLRGELMRLWGEYETLSSPGAARRAQRSQRAQPAA